MNGRKEAGLSRKRGSRSAGPARTGRSGRPPLVWHPQQYADRVERALEALSAGLRAAGRLAEFLLAQQSPDWRDASPLTNAAAELRGALRWLRTASATGSLAPPGRGRHRRRRSGRR